MKKMFYLNVLIVLNISFGQTQTFAQSFTETPEFLKANSHWFFSGQFTSDTSIATTSGGTLLNFNTSPPTTVVDTNVNITGWGQAAVSDTSTGGLLFCTNGDICWNKNLDTMPNGTSLAGDSIFVSGNIGRRPTAITNQAACIVPVIGDPDKYYVFSLQSSMLIPRLYYSVVDMTLDGGLGDVDPAQKRILVSDSTIPLGRSMMAVPGENCDIWLLVHSAFDTTFFAYHITEAGIDLTPVISSPGGISSGLDVTFEAGVMVISPDRSKLAISSYFPGCVPAQLFTSKGGVIVADFDATMGTVTNGIMADSSIAAFTLAFSPEGSKLYASDIDTSHTDSSGAYAGSYFFKSQICQYDLSVFTPAAITTSKVIIRDHPNYTQITSLRSRGDTLLVSVGTSTPARSLEYIASPNLPGLSCDYRTDQGYITDTVFTGSSFGTDVVYPYVEVQRQTVLDTTVCNGMTLHAPSLNISYQWDDGSTDSFRGVVADGQYWVEYNDGCHFGVDTFKIDVISLDPVINVNGFVLGTTTAFNTYQWIFDGNLIAGATQSTLTVSENGDYRVIVSDGVCTDTSEIYEVTNAGVGITRNSLSAAIKIYPNPSRDVVFVDAPIEVLLSVVSLEGKVLSESRKTNRLNIGSLAEGVYFIKVFNGDGVLLKVEKFVKSN